VNDASARLQALLRRCFVAGQRLSFVPVDASGCFSGPLAVRLGYDRELLAAVSERLARAVLQDMRRSVKREHELTSVAALLGGVVTVVQRFRSDLGLSRERTS